MKKVLIIVLVLGLALFGVYKYAYQSHRDIGKEEAAYTVQAKDIIKEFATNAEEATKKFLNQTVIVEGEVTEVEDKARTINEAVYCIFNENIDPLKYKIGEKLQVKGRCIGYDELLEVVKLDQSTIMN